MKARKPGGWEALKLESWEAWKPKYKALNREDAKDAKKKNQIPDRINPVEMFF